MGKITFSSGATIDEVYVNGYGYETTTGIDPSIFSKENLQKVTFEDGDATVEYKNALLIFYFTIIESDTLEYRFGFSVRNDEQMRKEEGVSYLAQLLLSDEQAAQAPFLFDEWDPNGVAYTAEVSKVQYNGLLYKCLQSHTSQASWTPTDAPSLWVRIDDPAEEWPEWRQPEGAHDAYAKGAKVTHNEKHWISDADNNVWEPGVYGWTESPIEETA